MKSPDQSLFLQDLGISLGVKLFLADFRVAVDSLEYFRSILSPGELHRVSQFGSFDSAQHFILRRGILRTLLADSTRLSPKDIVFTYGPYGKPALAEFHGTNLPQFNCASSDPFALFVIGKNDSVGVDIEVVRPDFHVDSLLLDHFTPIEREQLLSLSIVECNELFFQWWTRKESCAKAYGIGLSQPMSRFEVWKDVKWPLDGGGRGEDVELEAGWKGAVYVMQAELRDAERDQ